DDEALIVERLVYGDRLGNEKVGLCAVDQPLHLGGERSRSVVRGAALENLGKRPHPRSWGLAACSQIFCGLVFQRLDQFWIVRRAQNLRREPCVDESLRQIRFVSRPVIKGLHLVLETSV